MSEGDVDIYRITKKEYRRLKSLGKTTNDRNYIVFIAKNKFAYKVVPGGFTGAKAINNFNNLLPDIEQYKLL